MMESSSRSNSAWFSPSITTIDEFSPCFLAFCEERAFPSDVTGPFERRPLVMAAWD